MRRRGGWTVAIPFRDSYHAKSRLGGTPDQRRQLALAMARDTVSAAARARGVSTVLVVLQRDDDRREFDGLDVTFLALPYGGLNGALREAFSYFGNARRVAIPADLPYLRAEEVDDALGLAEEHLSVCVSDRSGTGTTLLTAAPGVDVVPMYGPDSFSRHVAAGSVDLRFDVASGLRWDVDAPADLVQTARLGECSMRLFRDGKLDSILRPCG